MSAGKIKAGAAYVEMQALDQTGRGIASARAKLQAFAIGAKAISDSIGAGFRTAGLSLMVPAGAMALIIASATRVAAGFDDVMRSVQAKSGANDSELDILREKAKELGATTSFTAQQVAEAMDNLAMAGFKSDQIVEMTDAVLALAQATGTELPLAAGIAAATLRQFELGASDADRVADVLALTATSTFNNLGDIAEAMKFVGPVAAGLGMTLEETAAIIGTLGNVGIQGSEAGTALKRLLTISAAEADKLQEIFGVAFLDASENARPLVDVLAEVNEATKDLPTGIRTSKFNEAFGLLGITAAGVVGKAAGDTRELQRTLEGAAGAAQEMANKMEAGIGGAIRRILSAIEGAKIGVFEALEPMFMNVAAAVESLANWINQLAKDNKEFIQSAVYFAGALAGVGAGLYLISFVAPLVGLAIAGVTAAFGIAAASITAFSAVATIAASPLLVPILAIVAGVAATVIGFGALITLVGILAYSFGALDGTIDGLSGAWGDFTAGVLSTGDVMRQALALGDITAAWEIALIDMALLWKHFSEGVFVSYKEMLQQLGGVFMTDAYLQPITDMIDKIKKQTNELNQAANILREGVKSKYKDMQEKLAGGQADGTSEEDYYGNVADWLIENDKNYYKTVADYLIKSKEDELARKTLMDGVAEAYRQATSFGSFSARAAELSGNASPLNNLVDLAKKQVKGLEKIDETIKSSGAVFG